MIFGSCIYGISFSEAPFTLTGFGKKFVLFGPFSPIVHAEMTENADEYGGFGGF